MADTLLVFTGRLRTVFKDYESLHTTIADASFPQPSGFERSQEAANGAAGAVGTAISAMVTSLGELGAGVWDVSQWYDETDACVQHDFNKYPRGPR